MYDIIGDIHGHAEALKELLHKMEYKEVNGIWRHRDRKVIFVGDYIDRGPAIRETLSIKLCSYPGDLWDTWDNVAAATRF